MPDDIFRRYTKLSSLKVKDRICPKCKNLLVEDTTLIPIGGNWNVKVPGMFCMRCENFYISDRDAVERILWDKTCSKNFTLDGTPLWNATEMKRRKKKQERKRARTEEEKKRRQEEGEKLCAMQGAVVKICMKYEDGRKREIIVTTVKSQSKECMHYTSKEARELLTAAYEGIRHRKGMLEGCSFRVVSVYYPNPDQTSPPYWILPRDISIKKGGGYYSTITDKNYELVDILAYSPYSQRYEIMHATYDSVEENCFIDSKIYREFLHMHGRPTINLYFERNHAYGGDWDALKSESILKSYGYSVNKTDNLPTSYRRELLSELIDLEILTVRQLVDYFDFFLSTHKKESEIEARYKWMSDKQYVLNYKMDVSRFFICK